MSHSPAYQTKLIQLKYDHAALAFEFALIKLELAFDRAVLAEARGLAAEALPPEDALAVSTGLSMIEGVMRGAENITQKAAEDHLHSFKQQMRDTFGIRVV